MFGICTHLPPPRYTSIRYEIHSFTLCGQIPAPKIMLNSSALIGIISLTRLPCRCLKTCMVRQWTTFPLLWSAKHHHSQSYCEQWCYRLHRWHQSRTHSYGGSIIIHGECLVSFVLTPWLLQPLYASYNSAVALKTNYLEYKTVRERFRITIVVRITPACLQRESSHGTHNLIQQPLLANTRTTCVRCCPRSRRPSTFGGGFL